MNYLIPKFKIIHFIVSILLFLNCRNDSNYNQEGLDLNGEIFYTFKDSYLPGKNEARILINVEKNNIHSYQVGKEVTLCFRNHKKVLLFTHIDQGQLSKDEYRIKAITIGEFKKNEISFEPSFSPITVTNEKRSDYIYEEGKTKTVLMKMRTKKNRNLEIVETKIITVKMEYPVFIK